MRKISLLIGLAVIITCASMSIAYDENTVHRSINENALVQSKTDDYLKNQLGFTNGIDDVVKGQRIRLWIMDGGTFEDKPVCRTKFHFHDPLKPSFGDAGLNDIIVDLGCTNFNHYSSLVWAQINAVDWPCPDPNSVKPWHVNLWSWQNARHYYYGALTGTDTDVREKKFALTFRALGQVMHLISDISVPAHARDDGHIFPPEEFESWTVNNIPRLLFSGIPIDQSIFNQAVNDPLAPAPISALWDMNKYIKDENPEVAVGTNIGLAEYTNVNFFSKDTINRKYKYPNWTSVSNQVEDSGIIDPRDPTRTVTRQYFKKDKHGDTGYRLSTVPFVVEYFNDFDQLEILRVPAILDGEVYADYASKLIPRAVGYSAGVLDYFFRGKIDVVEDEDVDGYVIKNDSDEDMDGKFELYYDTKTDERKQIQSGDFPLDTAIPAKGKSSKVTFTPPDDTKESCKYILVFQGKLGNEDGAVIGKSCTLGGPFLFILITKIIKDDWTEAGKNKIKYEGVFYGLAAGGGYGAPVVKSGYKVTFSHLNNVILKVNDVALPSYYWDYDQHFALTGVPATWSIVGDLTYPYGAGVVVNMSNDDWDYGYQFVGVYNAYLQYSNEYIFNNNPQLIGGSWYVNPPGVNCYTAEEKRAYFDFITATFQFNRPTYTRGPVRADWADFVKQQFEGLTGGYVGLAQLDRRVACFGAHCSDGFHAVGFYDNPVRPRLGYYWELPRIWRDSIVGLGVGADGPERLVAGRAGQSADYFTFGLCGWKLVNEHVGYHEPFACSGSPYNCVVEKDDDYGFETKHYLANLDSSNGYMGDECENEGCIPPLPEGGNKWIYADDMTLRFKTADITEGPLKKLWDQYNFHHFEYDIELEITVDTPELVQRTWVE